MAATVPARPRPQRQPHARPQARPEPQPRRRLRLVDDARLKAAQRRRRARLVMFAAGLVAVVLLFALAGFNAMLVTGQGRLDELERKVAEAQAEYSANRLEVARLESPEHVVQVAQRRLGMVQPDDVGYLAPTEQLATEAGTRAVQEPQQPVDVGASEWAAMKPYLNGQP